MELRQIASFVDSRPIEMLSRSQLWRVAERQGVEYPRDATKKQMIDLFDAMNVDVTQPESGIDWVMINGKDEHGNQTRYLAPVRPDHQSARDQVDSSALLNRKLSEEQEKNSAQKDRIGKLEDENTELKNMLGQLMDKIDGLSNDNNTVTFPSEPPPTDIKVVDIPSMEYWALFKHVKSLGHPVKRGMRRHELEALINGEDTT